MCLERRVGLQRKILELGQTPSKFTPESSIEIQVPMDKTCPSTQKEEVRFVSQSEEFLGVSSQQQSIENTTLPVPKKEL